MPPSSGTHLRYACLDHWRGLACLSVVLFHSLGPLAAVRHTLHPSVAPCMDLSSLGWFGVHLFFVISGYCVAAKIQRMIELGENPWMFLPDRFLRIFPAYWAALALSIVIAVLSAPFSSGKLEESLPDGLQGLLADVFLVHLHFQMPATLLVSWSLVHELAFYVLAASAFLLAARLHRPRLAGCFVVATAALALNPGYLPRFLISLKFWPEILCGAAVLMHVRDRARHGNTAWLWALFPVVLALVNLSPASDSLRISTLPASACFALLLMASHPFDRQISQAKMLKWLAWLGGISYSLYLVHLPITNRMMNGGLRLVDASSPHVLLLLGIVWCFTITVAYLFFRAVEKPMESMRHRIMRSSSHGLEQPKPWSL